MHRARTYNSIHELSKDAWNQCFVGNLEGHDYLAATEDAKIPDFFWRYIAIQENGKILAAAPLFIAEYNIETTLQGFARKAVLGVRKIFPGFLKFKLLCFGSPVAENSYFGFHPSAGDQEKIQYTNLIFEEFEKLASREKINLLGIKDVSDTDKKILDNVELAKEYQVITSMPTASLNIDFSNIDEYFEKLSKATRKDIRRKLKKLDELTIEKKTNIDEIIDVIYPMYLDTRSRSEWQFETLTKDYFKLVLEKMPENSFCNIYYAEGKALAANLFLMNEEILLDKYFCAQAEDARNYNIYFISWIENIKYCLKNGIKRYDAGQAGYENKIRLGCDLRMNWLYFRHRNFIINFMLRLAAPMLAADHTIKPLEKKQEKDEK